MGIGYSLELDNNGYSSDLSGFLLNPELGVNFRISPWWSIYAGGTFELQRIKHFESGYGFTGRRNPTAAGLVFGASFTI